MTIYISFDLETWGTEPGCDIRSIGACVFDPVTGTVGDEATPSTHYGKLRDVPAHKTFYIATSNPKGYYGKNNRFYQTDRGWQRKYNLARDPRTVQWWSDQSDEAQGAFTDPVDLGDALHEFSAWLFRLTDQLYDRTGITTCDPSPDIRLWSHGAATDGPWLVAAYKAVGLPVPWHYRAPRDTRTCFDMAGVDDHTAWLKQHPGPLGIPHHALDDAICQAWAVCAAMAKIRVLTSAEIRSGLDRVRHAELLIKQLPADHDGRNTWLLNYGGKP